MIASSLLALACGGDAKGSRTGDLYIKLTDAPGDYDNIGGAAGRAGGGDRPGGSGGAGGGGGAGMGG